MKAMVSIVPQGITAFDLQFGTNLLDVTVSFYYDDKKLSGTLTKQ